MRGRAERRSARVGHRGWPLRQTTAFGPRGPAWVAPTTNDGVRPAIWRISRASNQVWSYGVGPNGVRPTWASVGGPYDKRQRSAHMGQRGCPLRQTTTFGPRGRAPLAPMTNDGVRPAWASAAGPYDTRQRSARMGQRRWPLRIIVGVPGPFLFGPWSRLRILPIQLPARRVRENVLANPEQFILVANDMFEIILLPHGGARSIPKLSNPTRKRRFEPRRPGGQRMGAHGRDGTPPVPRGL